MSSTVIRSFVNTYNHIFVGACKHKNIKLIPFPKTPINTDELINKYSSELNYFIHNNKINNPEKYDFRKVEPKFPNKYFNYESS